MENWPDGQFLAGGRKMTGRKTLVFSVGFTCCFVTNFCAGAASRRVFLQNAAGYCSAMGGMQLKLLKIFALFADGIGIALYTLPKRSVTELGNH